MPTGVYKRKKKHHLPHKPVVIAHKPEVELAVKRCKYQLVLKGLKMFDGMALYKSGKIIGVVTDKYKAVQPGRITNIWVDDTEHLKP